MICNCMASDSRAQSNNKITAIIGGHLKFKYRECIIIIRNLKNNNKKMHKCAWMRGKKL